MSGEYLLSVDLGTSHTVAVVRWPDGRTRPLLFDGSPVMPSAVFLDEAGTIHVGRDAERLSSTAPERFEPNPKQRIADGTMLLGDREIPVASALEAILRRVAQLCVESIGGLPQTVLTCPAAWGEHRRAVLYDAAAQAGFPPVQIVTEPVAAAHYYTTRLANPINPGQAIAVFDFGGGTLDVAVVGRHHDGSFTVLADGGLPDLGGLDVDAALVAHIGDTVKRQEPDLWKRLEQPTSATELRDRRTLWIDVRGAKEMLSRSSVAPVTVPGLEQALHLTRGELDQLARPLLSRAVGETQRVLGLSGVQPGQLAGLFLVGGSSRMPMVAKLLHEHLGIPPTVLEQPELPVSEGAAVALAGPAPVTPPTMSPPHATSPQTMPYGSLPPQASPPDPTLQLRPGGPVPGPRPKRTKLIAAVAIVAVLAVAAPLIWLALRADPYEQRPFLSGLEPVGDPIPYQSENFPGDYFRVFTRNDKALFAYSDANGLNLVAVDLADGSALWEQRIAGEGWDAGPFLSDELLVIGQVFDASGSKFARWHFLDWNNGELVESVRGDHQIGRRSGDHLVSIATTTETVTAYDRNGGEAAKWRTQSPITAYDHVDRWEDYLRPTARDNGDGRMWALTSDGVVHVFDIANQEVVFEGAIESPEDLFFAYAGKLFVAVESNGYRLYVYDIDDDMANVGDVRVNDPDAVPEAFWVCGETRVCVAEATDDGQRFRVYDFDDGKFVYDSSETYTNVKWATPIGNRLMVQFFEGDGLRTQLLDDDFKPVGNSQDGTFAPIDGGTGLAWPSTESTYSTTDGPVVGLGAQDGSRTTLTGSLEVWGTCAPTDTHLACFTTEGLQIYQFRE
jgi:actin-like ATPase involved in cell morphogenesis